jgi:hypothetical protein
MSRRPRDRADIFATAQIIPVIAAAFETYPELDISDVLALCVPALADALRAEFIEIRRATVNEVRARWNAGRDKRAGAIRQNQEPRS